MADLLLARVGLGCIAGELLRSWLGGR